MYNKELSPQAQEVGKAFATLYDIICYLRGPNGCPWDKTQTIETLHPHLIEECYELLEGLKAKDYTNITEELGDVYLVNSLIAQVVAEERQGPQILQALQGICDKLIRRHPHVFGNAKALTPQEGHDSWIRAKQEEKKKKGESTAQGYLARAGRGLPPLEQAQKIQQKMNKVGFDWPNTQSIFNKISEELTELQAELCKETKENIKEELGDVLFSVIALAEHMGINASEALYFAIQKVVNRVHKVEHALQEKDLTLCTENRPLMEELWLKAKSEEK